VARPTSGLPLSFGAGPHVCIGAALTTLEAERLFAALIGRWPSLQATQTAPDWLGNAVYRGLRQLPVRAVGAV
jgi:cytochrome P450